MLKHQSSSVNYQINIIDSYVIIIVQAAGLPRGVLTVLTGTDLQNLLDTHDYFGLHVHSG